MRTRWKRLILTALAVGLAGVLALVAMNAAVLSGRRQIRSAAEVAPAHTAIVLGALVYPDGRVSHMVEDRLLTAFDLYQAGKVKKILITGDHGQVEYDEVNTMRRFLENKGVPSVDIFMDHAGFDTYDSMYRARDVFQVKDTVVVTQRFHLPRALWIAKRMGLDAQGVVADRRAYAGADYYEYREMAARVKAFGEVLFRRKPVFLGPVIPITGDGRATHDQPR